MNIELEERRKKIEKEREAMLKQMKQQKKAAKNQYKKISKIDNSQDNDSQEDDYQNDDYQNDDYQNDDYQNDDYQNDDYQNDDYQDDSYQDEVYQEDDYQNGHYQEYDYSDVNKYESEEDPDDEPYEDEERYQKSPKEQAEEQKEKKQKFLLLFHRLWRIVNWVIITWLANSALWRVIHWSGLQGTGEIKTIFFLVTVAIATIMVILAEGTSHDKIRTKTGIVITWAAEAVMLIPPVLMKLVIEAINAFSRLVQGNIFNSSIIGIGVFWLGNLILAVLVSASLVREEQSTDKRLGFARTPQKKKYKDINMAANDDDGNKVIRITDYNK